MGTVHRGHLNGLACFIEGLQLHETTKWSFRISKSGSRLLSFYSLMECEILAHRSNASKMPFVVNLPPCDLVGLCDYFFLMNRSEASRDEGAAPGTLGELLYSDRSAVSIPEQDWVSLVRSIAAGNQQALRFLFERTHRLVFTLAMRISNSRENAEEITLDVFHDIWRRSAEYDPKNGSVIGWIMNQARSRAIDRVRFEQRKKRVAPAGEQPSAEVPGAAEAVDARRRSGLLQEALTALTADERSAVETAFFSELTYSETAVRLGQPLGTVKTRIRSALAKLRKALGSDRGEP
jgi:RNA polymerase sigma-70 factor, ECF subfamily